jgi:hypothetical protein
MTTAVWGDGIIQRVEVELLSVNDPIATESLHLRYLLWTPSFRDVTPRHWVIRSRHFVTEWWRNLKTSKHSRRAGRSDNWRRDLYTLSNGNGVTSDAASHPARTESSNLQENCFLKHQLLPRNVLRRKKAIRAVHSGWIRYIEAPKGE